MHLQTIHFQAGTSLHSSADVYFSHLRNEYWPLLLHQPEKSQQQFLVMNNCRVLIEAAKFPACAEPVTI
jgi:hypothetical protein